MLFHLTTLLVFILIFNVSIGHTFFVNSDDDSSTTAESLQSSSTSGHQSDKCQQSAGSPLYLSKCLPYNFQKGQRLAEVNVPFFNKLNIKSYSGYFTVDPAFNSNLFFWYFPAEKSPKSAPVALVLGGGPGASSLYSIFENGPITLNPKNGKVLPTKYSWTKNHHVIYIDNPVGTGYSFTNSDAGYSNNQTIIAKYLVTALEQFFQLFPCLQKLPFYVTGESYAGQYVPALSHALLNTRTNPPINFRGIAIGNGAVDPENQFDYGDYLYQLGLVDRNGRAQFNAVRDQLKLFINQGLWLQATILYLRIFISPFPPYNQSLYAQLTGLPSNHNYLEGAPGHPVLLEDPTPINNFLNETVRSGINVGNNTFYDINNVVAVNLHLAVDLLKSQKDNLCEALQHVKVYLYDGQLDVQIAYPMMENYLQLLNCSGMAGYSTAVRQIWRVDNNVAGYVKKSNNLTEIMIRNAGHAAPIGQPCWSLIMIKQLTSKQNFANLNFTGCSIN